MAIGRAPDPIHDHYRGLDAFAFHQEYANLDTGIDHSLLTGDTSPHPSRITTNPEPISRCNVTLRSHTNLTIQRTER